MLKRYMHKRERHLAMLNANRVVRPFEWGTEFIGEDADADDPHVKFAEFSRRTIEGSDEYFSVPNTFDFHVSDPPLEPVDATDPNPRSEIRNPKSNGYPFGFTDYPKG